jgi:hypothetical protein
MFATLAPNTTDSLLASGVAVAAAWRDERDTAFELSALCMFVAARVCLWVPLRAAFGQLHALESTYAVEKVLKTAFFLVVGPEMIREYSVGPAELFRFALFLAVFGFHQIAAKRQEMFEQGIASTAGYRYARMMLLLGVVFFLDVLAVTLHSSAVARLQAAQQTEACQAEVSDVEPFVTTVSDELRVASLLLFHWSLLAIQCANTLLLASLHLFQSFIRRPVTAQIRVFVDVSTELLKCAAYADFARRSAALASLYLLMWVFPMWRLIRHRSVMRWVTVLPMPSEAQLRGKEELTVVTPSPPAISGAPGTTGPTAPTPGSGEPAQCAICYDDVGDNPQSARCLPCGHIFHVQCLSRWLEINGTCPYCRRDFGALWLKAPFRAVDAAVADAEAIIGLFAAEVAVLF